MVLQSSVAKPRTLGVMLVMVSLPRPMGYTVGQQQEGCILPTPGNAYPQCKKSINLRKNSTFASKIKTLPINTLHTLLVPATLTCFLESSLPPKSVHLPICTPLTSHTRTQSRRLCIRITLAIVYVDGSL